MNSSTDSSRNEEDQLKQINLQALKNRDPYITKIIDQAQRVCVYKFLAEKRQWEKRDLEGTLFVYERFSTPSVFLLNICCFQIGQTIPWICCFEHGFT